MLGHCGDFTEPLRKEQISSDCCAGTGRGMPEEPLTPQPSALLLPAALPEAFLSPLGSGFVSRAARTNDHKLSSFKQ